MSGENGSGGVFEVTPTLEPPYSEVAPWLRGLHSFVAVVLMLASLLGNFFVLWVVARNKELQYRSILTSMGAVAVNILFSLLTSPQVVAGSVTGEWPFGHVGCVTIGYIANGVFYVRWLNAFQFAVDRFLCILTPFWYERNSKPVLVVMSIIAWTVPFISNVPSALYETYSFRSTFTFCAVNCENNGTCYNTYVFLLTVYMILGVLIPTFIYTFLYCYGKKKRREMNREMGTQAPEEETPTCNGAANGYLPSEHYLAARRPSTDLVSIEEEDETGSTAMQESSSQSPPSHKTGIYVGSPHEHTVIDITTLRSGATEPDTTSAESETNHTQTAAETETRHCVAEEEEEDDESATDCKNPWLHKHAGHRRGSGESSTGSVSSNPLGPRRASFVVLSRAALTAIIPSRQHSASNKRETRAMATFALLLTNLVLTQIMVFALAAMRRREFYTDIPIWVHLIAVNLFLLAPVLEPLIIVKNQDFKRVLTKMFRRRNSFSMSHSTTTR